MGKGNVFGQEQRFSRRQQNQWANVQARDYRAQQVDPIEALRRREALRVRLATRTGGPEQTRAAQEEAEARAERDRLDAEAHARELYRQERERINLLRRQRRETAKAAKHALTAQQEAAQRAQDEARRLQEAAANKAEAEQWSADLETLSDIRANLPLLRNRAQAALRRSEQVQRILTGTPGADLTAAQNNTLLLNTIVARCIQSIAAADLAYRGMMAADVSHTEAATRNAVVSLQTVLADYVTDDPAATQALAETAAAELTYKAALDLAALYPNLGLTFDLIGKPSSPTARLTANQLAALNLKLEGHRVLSWTLTNLPASRPLGNISCYVPQNLQNFPYQPGGEIFCDWIFPYEGHGQSARDMRKYLDPIADNSMKVKVGPNFFLDLKRSQGNGTNWVVTMNNSNTRIVFTNNMVMLITYFIAS